MKFTHNQLLPSGNPDEFTYSRSNCTVPTVQLDLKKFLNLPTANSPDLPEGTHHQLLPSDKCDESTGDSSESENVAVHSSDLPEGKS